MYDFFDDLWVWLKARITDPSVIEYTGALLAAFAVSLMKNVRAWFKRVFFATKNMFQPVPHRIDASTVKRGKDINRELAKLFYTLDACRVSVYQFHNGDSFVLSNPIFKMSCEYEQAKDGLMFDSAKMKAVHVSQYLDLIAPLVDDTRDVSGVEDFIDTTNNVDAVNPFCMLKYSIEELPYTPFKHFMRNQNVQTLYAAMLYIRKHPIGILSVQFTDSDNHNKTMRSEADSIGESIHCLEYLLDPAQ